MIRIGKPQDNVTVEIGSGALLECRPMRTAIKIAADFAAARADPGEGVDMEVRVGAAHSARLAAAAKAAVVSWQGVGDADGNEVAPTCETIGELLSIPDVAAAFERNYWTPGIESLNETADEKNV